MHYALGKKYPIETKEQVKIAEDYFTKYLTRFDPADRVIAASNIEKRANQVGAGISEGWITNYSRMTKISAQISPTFEHNINLRKEACDETVEIQGRSVSAYDALDKIAQLRAEGAKGELLIQALEEFDKVACLENDYDSTIVDPVMTVYGNLSNPEFDTVKLAEGITDYSAKRASCDEEVLTKIASTFGNEVAESFKNYPMNTLLSTTGPELDILSSMIREA